jgi:hypothetical protein
MDIHKPKPWRGLREFLKEYVIIVVGVLTALGAEQAVEWLHHTTEVSEARATLHDEVRRDMTTLVLQAREDRCAEGLLNRLDAWARGGPKPAWNRDLFPSLRTSVWDMERTGAVQHMELKERLALANFYGGIENQTSIVNRVRELMSDLRGDHNLTTLSPQAADDTLKAVGRARPVLAGEAANAPRLVGLGRSLGVEPGEPDADQKARVDDICRAAGVDG